MLPIPCQIMPKGPPGPSLSSSKDVRWMLTKLSVRVALREYLLSAQDVNEKSERDRYFTE